MLYNIAHKCISGFQNNRKRIIAIALLFGFVSMHEVNAQNWEVPVVWTDGCDDCTQITGHEYYVCLKITNICTQTELSLDCVVKASGVYTHTFDVTDALLIRGKNASICRLK